MVKSWLLVAFGCAIALAAQAAPALWSRQTPPTRRINQAQYDLIEPGLLPRNGAEDILSGPPGDYTVKRPLATIAPSLEAIQRLLRGGGETPAVWSSDEGAILLVLNQHGTVVGKTFFPGDPPKASPVGWPDPPEYDPARVRKHLTAFGFAMVAVGGIALILPRRDMPDGD
jgi:hypothetical protein